MNHQQSKAIPKKVIRRPRSEGLSRSKVMSLYRAHVQQFHSNTAPVLISQRTTVIGTNNSWFNAQTIQRNPAWVDVDNARYVWYSGNLNSNNAIISRRFRLARNRRILRSSLFLSVDNYAVVIINGTPLVFDGPTNDPSQFNPGRTFNIRRFLRRGLNSIVIIAFNFDGDPRSNNNPAGVAARLNIRQSDIQ